MASNKENQMNDRDFIQMCNAIRAKAIRESLSCGEGSMTKEKVLEVAKEKLVIAEDTAWKGANKAAKAVDKGLTAYNDFFTNIERKLFKGETIDDKLNRFFSKLFD
jgi:hypothetical protein